MPSSGSGLRLRIPAWKQCRRHGASATPNVLVCRQSGQNVWKSVQNSWIFGQKWLPTWFDFWNWRQRLQWNTWWPFCRGQTKRVFHDLCGKKFLGKVAQKRFGHFWENSEKNPSNPQTFACSYTYAWKHLHKKEYGLPIVYRAQVTVCTEQNALFNFQALKTKFQTVCNAHSLCISPIDGDLKFVSDPNR